MESVSLWPGCMCVGVGFHGKCFSMARSTLLPSDVADLGKQQGRFYSMGPE